MTTRRLVAMLIAVVVAVAFALFAGAAQSDDEVLDHVPVHGRVAPHGRFVGHLTITAVAVDDARHLFLTGVLQGTATDRTGATTQVRPQPFTAPATVMEADHTTDVLLLQLGPMTLTSVGKPITLAPIPLDIDAVPEEGPLLALRRPTR
jgi:hypothetical protein